MNKTLLFFFLCALLCSHIFAEEEILIDFSEIRANVEVNGQSYHAETARYDEDGNLLCLLPEHWTTRFSEGWYIDPRMALPMEDGVELYYSAIPYDDWRYPGEQVLGIRGVLSLGNPEVLISPPFRIPEENPAVLNRNGEIASSRENRDRGGRYENFGLLRDVQAIKEISLVASSNGAPVDIGLMFSDDGDNYFSVSFLADGAEGVWYTYTFVNPMWQLEMRFPEFQLRHLKLEYIFVHTAEASEYFEQRYRDMAHMTDEEKYRYETDNPVEDFISTFEIQIKEISIVHGNHSEDFF